LFALAIGLSGCSHHHADTGEYSTLPPEVLYAQGIQHVEQQNYDEAVTSFDSVEENYPYSTWTTHAQLMEGYSQYKQQDYDDAISAANRGFETAVEGPFGDHTGYYNETERFPVFTVERITMRRDALFLSTHTGRPPDEPSVLGAALNEVFVPLLQRTFPEIVDFFLPPEACSYRMAVVSMRKQYPGHARRVMFGIWSFLRQFMYTKFVIVVDDDIDVRNWTDVIWAISTRVDPLRDTVLVDNTPIDYLDFASPVAGLGSKMGIDATNKLPGETNRAWGRRMTMSAAVKARVDGIWTQMGLEPQR